MDPLGMINCANRHVLRRASHIPSCFLLNAFVLPSPHLILANPRRLRLLDPKGQSNARTVGEAGKGLDLQGVLTSSLSLSSSSSVGNVNFVRM